MDEFIIYIKEEYGYDITLKEAEPDTFESIFGASFLNQNKTKETIGGKINETIPTYYPTDAASEGKGE